MVKTNKSHTQQRLLQEKARRYHETRVFLILTLLTKQHTSSQEKGHCELMTHRPLHRPQLPTNITHSTMGHETKHECTWKIHPPWGGQGNYANSRSKSNYPTAAIGNGWTPHRPRSQSRRTEFACGQDLRPLQDLTLTSSDGPFEAE